MYRKIYEYIVDIEIREREDYHEHIEKFIEEYENGIETYEQIGEKLSKLLKETRKFEELEDMENFLWEKVYSDKKESDK